MAKVFEMLQARWDAGKRICVGLDSDMERLPANLSGNQSVFNISIVDVTHAHALAYKFNIAFYVTEGERDVLSSTIAYIRRVTRHFPVPVILDGKRADIGNTNNGYVREIRLFKPDAATINPYLGMRALEPFLASQDIGMFVVCHTSDEGAEEFQELLVYPHPDDASRWGLTTKTIPLYQNIAYRVARTWSAVSGNCGLVMGATMPGHLAAVRKIIGDDMWILAPGIGAQGGDLREALQAGLNTHQSGLVINSGRDIIFASNGMDFAEAAQRELLRLTQESDTVLSL